MKKDSYLKFLLGKDATLADALAAITDNKKGAVLIVDRDKTLVGVVSDGDIRRALVKGATTFTPIKKVTNLNVKSVQKKGSKADDSRVIFDNNRGVNLIPVLDAANRVCDVIARE